MAAPVPTNPTPTGAAPGGAAVGANPSTPYASASLYVGDLAADVTEALLFEIFNAVGPVASVRVCRDAATRRSLGYAYVNFHRVDDAERALDTMNFKNIRNRPCRIMWSHRDPALRRSGVGNVFVNHLAKSIDNKQLYDTFSMFGNILSCKVAMNGKRESLGYGFVHYESDESAQAAIQRVDGKVIAGQKVSVSTFKSKKERGGANKFKYTNVFVKNLPGEITKEQVDALFSKYGTVTSSMLTADRENKQRAFGFVNFAAPEEAAAAVEGLHDSDYQGKKLYVSRAMKKDEREKELREKFEQLKNERQKKYAGVNLYVKNLSDEMDDERLNQEFAKFGSISSAKIMRDQAGKSRGFGFVCYSTPEEATKAVTEMNGRMLDGKPLYVALAQRKEMRRAQLESQYAQRAKMGGPMQGQGVLNGPMAPQMGYPAQQQPMFLGGIPPQQRNYMYPQQVVPRWAGPQGPNQGMMGAVAMGARGPHPNINYQLMPVNPRGPQGQPQMGPGGMPNGAGPRAAQQQQQRAGAQQHPGAGQNRGPRPAQVQGQPQIYQQQAMQQQGQNIRYTDNVRNRAANAGMPMVQQQQQVPAEQVVMPAPNEPLTIKALAAAPEEMRKQMIGERLFPLIKLQEPALAGKITGMLLEMDNGELIHLLESQQALQEKIAEALQVLQQHPMEHQEEADK